MAGEQFGVTCGGNREEPATGPWAPMPTWLGFLGYRGPAGLWEEFLQMQDVKFIYFQTSDWSGISWDSRVRQDCLPLCFPLPTTAPPSAGSVQGVQVAGAFGLTPCRSRDLQPDRGSLWSSGGNQAGSVDNGVTSCHLTSWGAGWTWPGNRSLWSPGQQVV